MLRSISSRLSYANVVATLALFLALGGGAYAAVKLPANSVGAKQIKKGAVRSADVKDASLLVEDFRGGELPAGPKGAQGPAGARGPAGAQGPQGPGCPPADPACRGPQGTPGANGLNGATNVTVRTGAASPSNALLSIARCQPGQRATGGGGAGGPIVQSAPYLIDEHAGLDQPAGNGIIPNAWGVTLASGTASSWVVCASP